MLHTTAVQQCGSMPRAVCSFVPWLSTPASLGTIAKALKLRTPPHQSFGWSKRRVFRDAAHEYNGIEARGAVRGDDLCDEDALAAAAAEDFLHQLGTELEYNALLLCDDSPDSGEVTLTPVRCSCNVLVLLYIL